MNITMLLAMLAIPASAGAAVTWLWSKRRERGTIAMRLARLTPQYNAPLPALLKKKTTDEGGESFSFETLPGIVKLKAIMVEAACEQQFESFLMLLFALFFTPLLLSVALDWNFVVCLLVGAALPVVPVVILNAKAEARRRKFAEQLPDAIDLMVAVLRSGHSISQAVKSVAQDVPKPCGEEFENVLHRINLGQTLAAALLTATGRFRSYELDLLRRAVAIQAEVGGSLAELLDKTNTTLRERLKLSRQLHVITAQSRLSAQIVGLLPIVLAIALNNMSPGYLQLLLDDKLGQSLLLLSAVLEVIGVFVMNKMSTMKV